MALSTDIQAAAVAGGTALAELLRRASRSELKKCSANARSLLRACLIPFQLLGHSGAPISSSTALVL